MSKIWLYIKKFFAMLASIIYGAFKNRIDDKEESQKESHEEIEKIAKNKDKATRTFHDDDPSEKARSSYEKSKEEDEIIYNAGRDIQKLLFIQKNLEKIEFDLSKCEDIDEVYSLKEEWKKAKFHFDKIASQYEKVNIDERIIKDIKKTIKDTDKMIVSQEKKIDNKIFKLKKEQPKEDKQEEIKEEQEGLEVVKTNVKIGIVEEPKKVIEEKHKEEPKEEESKEVQEEKEEQEKEVFEEEQVNNLEEKIEIKEIDEIIPDKKSPITKEKDAKIRKIPIDFVNVKKKEDKARVNKYRSNIGSVVMILAQARAIAASTNISALLQLNATIAISSTLHVNNEVRRARRQTGTKVKDLSIEKVVTEVGMNPQLQARYIVANSLKEIRKLRAELRQCGNTPEVVNALNELDELEMELLLQINELQMQNQNQQNRHR